MPDADVNPTGNLRGIAPRFLVPDLVQAANYYRDQLGFPYNRLWGEPPCFTIVHRDGIQIMLSESERSTIHPNGAVHDTWDAYLWISDADSLFEEYTARGVEIVYPPQIMEEYGMKEFAIRDLNGYILGFGQDVESRR